MNFLRPLVWLTLVVVPLFAQQGGFITGTVHDRSGGAVSGAEVRVQSETTGARQKLYCDAMGHYSTNMLAQGTYKITVRSDGFRTITQASLNVESGKALHADFMIDLLPLEQEVTVEAAPDDEDPAASGLAVSREPTQNNPRNSLPVNGRDVHALFNIIPGATITPASISSGGQFTVGGQRPNANSFRVDGASGNVGIGIISVPGAFPGTTLPGMTTIGSMQSLASKEETERVDLRMADFAASSGDRPGAEISIETRSGANEFHGSAFGYLRPHALDSHDWFSQSVGAGLPAAYLNGWGGSLGGPLWKNHTYFFTSFERSDVHDSALQLIPVPSVAARAEAGNPYAAFLDSFPLPTGRALSATQSIGTSPLQKAAAITNESIRLDQTIRSHIHIFGHSSNVPSNSTSIELGTAYSQLGWLSATAGATIVTADVIQEFRFNFSQATAATAHAGNPSSDKPSISAIDFALTGPFKIPGGLITYGTIGAGITAVSISGVGQNISGQTGMIRQRQQEVSYSIAKTLGRHTFRAGADYVKLSPSQYVSNNTLSVVSQGIDALLAGVPLGITHSYFDGPFYNTYQYPFFVQDTVHSSDRLQLLFGLRWEMTPPTFAAANGYPAPSSSFVGYWKGIGAAPAPIDNVLSNQRSRWPTNNSQYAPRAGLAYHLKVPDLVLRVGAGVFYDADMGSAIANADPLNSWVYAPTVTAPSITVSPTPVPPAPVLSLPRILEWRTSIEKSVTEKTLFSLSYFGSAGHNLLRIDANAAAGNLLQSLAFTSYGKSNYQAMLAQFHGNVTPNLYVLLSYTWSHSIDTGSSDTAVFLTPLSYNDAMDKGSSSFDVRHVFTASLSYRMQASTFQPFLRRFLGGWNASSTLQARSGFPFDVTTVDRSIGLGFDNTGRADLVPGEPIWIGNNSLPGGRELNPAAFQIPTSGVNGTLGRNVLTGSGLFQIDLSLRRQFLLYRGVSMEASVSAFNLLNHPSFADPVNYLGSALFGQSTSSTNLMLGSGSPTTGLTPLFQAGGPRTVELGLRFSF
jgi:hypothetical protein